MVLRVICSCGWSRYQKNKYPQGRLLEILKGIHEITFKDHTCRIGDEDE